MEPKEFFRYCPRCGAEGFAPYKHNAFACESCGLSYYINAAAAVGVILRDHEGRHLFTRRAREPAKDTLDLPGGFIDFNESAEDALRREVREELSVAIESLDYLCSLPNQYTYKDVTYHTLDVFFLGTLAADSRIETEESEISEVVWMNRDAINPDAFGLASVKKLIGQYVDGML